MARGCTQPDCERVHYAKDLCRLHYRRQARGTDLSNPYKFEPGTYGRWYFSTKGYVQRSRRMDGRAQIQWQHRWVMEQHLGRPLLDCENVHHRNGVKSDNRLSNLELWSSTQPSGQRVEDKLAWAREIIALYGDIAPLP